MKKRNLSFDLILGYYALTYLFFFFKIDSFLKDLLIAPLYFLVPTGIGLLVFTLFDTHKKLLKTVTKMQLILSSCFTGFLLISLAYIELNNRGALPGVFFYVYPCINLLSLLGFHNGRDLLRVEGDCRPFLRGLVLLFPLICTVYYFYFLHFSRYPLRDIFMEVHFMKGAMEFSKYHILNLATGDSYFPLLQVHEGVLHYFYSYDLINSQWIIPFYLALVHVLCYYCFYASFVEDRFTLYTALAFSIVHMSVIFSNTNNGYLLLLSLVLFSILVQKNRERAQAAPVLLELAGLGVLSITCYVHRLYPPISHTFFPALVFYLLLICLISYLNLNRLLPLALVVLLLLIAPQYHRAAALYLPLVLALYAFYFLSFQWGVADRPQFKAALLKKIIRYTPFCLAGGILLALVVSEIWPSAAIYVKRLLDPICAKLVGQTIDSNIGLVGTMAEWIRFVPPGLHFLFLLLAGMVYLIWKRRGGDFPTLFTGSNLNLVIFCIMSAAGLLVILFSPLPNVHRVAVFPPFMVFVLTATMLKLYFEECWSRGEESSEMLIVLPLFVLAYTVAAGFVYDLSWKGGPPGSPYVSALSPLPEMGTVMLLLVLLVLRLRAKTPLAWLFVLMAVLSGAALDQFRITSKLYENSYGSVDLSGTRVISHYSQVELNAARVLGARVQSPGFVMVSDPYTLGIFEAVTGLNGFYTFANLGVMQKQYEDDMKGILRRIFPREDPPWQVSLDYRARNEEVLEALTGFVKKNKGAVPEAEYTLQTRLGIPLDPMRWKDRIIFILTEKTVNWAHGEVGYFPQNEPFSRAYIRKYILPYFSVIHSRADRVLILKLK